MSNKIYNKHLGSSVTWDYYNNCKRIYCWIYNIYSAHTVAHAYQNNTKYFIKINLKPS